MSRPLSTIVSPSVGFAVPVVRRPRARRRGLLLLPALGVCAIAMMGCIMPPMAGAGMMRSSLVFDAVSDYVYRGKVETDDWSVQSSFLVVDGPWTLELWGNTHLSDDRGANGKLTETRFRAHLDGSSMPGWPWKFGFGYIYYDYPKALLDPQDPTMVLPDRPTKQEIYLTLKFDNAVFVPQLTIFREIGSDNEETTYASLKLTTPFMLPLGLSQSGQSMLTVTFGYGDQEYNFSNFFSSTTTPTTVDDVEAGVTDMTITLELPMSQQMLYQFVPYISYMKIMDNTIADQLALQGEKDKMWYWGVRLSLGF